MSVTSGSPRPPEAPVVRPVIPPVRRSSIQIDPPAFGVINRPVVPVIPPIKEDVAAPSPPQSNRSIGTTAASVLPENRLPTTVDKVTMERLEATLKNQQDVVNEARRRYLEYQRAEANKKQNDLKKHIKDLDAVTVANNARRNQLGDEIDRLRLKTAQAARESEEMQARHWETEQVHQMEMLALQKIQLERIRERQALTEKMFMKRAVALEGIRELRKRDEVGHRGNMDAILKKAELLEKELSGGALPDDKINEYAIKMGEGEIDASSVHMIDEVLQHRRTERQNAQRDRMAQLRELNQERLKVAQRRDEVAKQRDLHERVMEKGLDYLVEVELGNAPPEKFLRANMQASVPVQYDDAVEDVVKNLKSRVYQEERRLNALKSEYRQTVAKELRPFEYKGEFSIMSVEPWQRETYTWIQKMVWSMVDNIIKLDIADASDINELRKAQQLWEEEQKLLQEQITANHEKQTLKVLTDQLITEVTEDFIGDIYQESLMVERLATTYSNGLIVSVIEELSNKAQYHAMLEASLAEFVKVKQENYPDAFLHTHGASFQSHDEASAAAQAAGSAAASDVTLLRLDTIPDHSVFTEYMEREQRYWTFIDIYPVDFEAKKGGITCTASSSSGRFLAVGTTNGDVLIWNISGSPSLIRSSRTANFVATQIIWSMDESRLIVLDQKFTIRIFSMRSDAQPSEDARVLPLTMLLEIPKGALAVPDVHFIDGVANGTAVADPELLFPVTMHYHPSFTLLGTQPSFVVGLKGGEIIKCNTDEAPYAIYVKPLLPPEKLSVLSMPSGGTVSVELFAGHHSQVVFTGFIASTSTMISVDETGFVFVWPYSNDYYAGFGWFRPSKKLKLDIVDLAFTPLNDEVTLHFATDFIMKRDKSLKEKNVNRERLEKSKRRAEQAILDLALPQDPWHSINAEDDVFHYIYQPYEPQRTEVFHTLSFHRNNLIAHRSQTYVLKNNKGFVVDAQLSTGGHDLVIMLYFPPMNPKGGYVSFVTLDLKKFELRSPRIDIPLAGALRGRASFVITPVLDGLSSDYIYAHVENTLHVLSLASGLPVKDPISIFPDNDSRQLTGIDLVGGHMAISLQCPTVSTILLYQIEDKNIARDRVMLARLADDRRMSRCPVEKRFRSVKWTFQVGDQDTTYVNVPSELRLIVEDLIELAVTVARQREQARPARRFKR